MEPQLKTDPKIFEIMRKLLKREPIFHHPEYGTTREDFEKMTEETFEEVGASGKRYSRKFILDTLEQRYKNQPQEDFEIQDLICLEISRNVYPATYTLTQNNKRVTRSSTIWKKKDNDWKIVYHQGTMVEQK